MAAPAVRVGVVDLGTAHEGSASDEEVDDLRVGFEDLEAVVLGESVAETAGGIDVAELREAVFGSGVKVVGAVGRSGVDGSGALLSGDVVGKDSENGAIEEWVLEGDAVHARALEAGDLDGFGKIAGFAGLRGEGLGDDVDVTVGVAESDVVELGVEGYGERGWESPRGGGPDDGVDAWLFVAVGTTCQSGVDLGGVAGEFVTDVDRGRGVHLVLDLSLGEGGAVVDAPVDGLEAFVDEALFEEVVEGLDDRGLVGEGHGEVGIVPAAEDADALELASLEIDVLLGVLAAGFADGEGVHLEFFAAELLVDLDLDGEAVAVPAGDVGGVEACHGLRFDDEVLDALVEGMAEVDGSVGVGWTVVKDVFGGTGAGGTDLFVKILSLPGGKSQGLVDREIGLHGEGGLGQVQRGLQRFGFGHGVGCFRH